jgi:hypothetical protein
MTRTGRTWHMDCQVKGWSSVVLGAAALWGCQTPAPPLPAQTPPKPELSYLNIAISIPLEPFEKAAEEEVPRAVGVEPFKYQMNGGAAPPACGMDAGYSITRAPLGMSASGSGDAIITSVDLSYWLKGRKQIPCPGPATTASCGTDGEPARTAKVAINTTITVLPSLATNVNSTLQPVVPGNRCVLHPVELDITDQIMTGFEGSLKKMVPRLDKRVAAALNLRKRAETGWARMSEPTELRPGLWLALNPEGIGVVPITVAEGELRTGLQVRLRPVVTAGKKPEAQPKPFPPADIATPSDSFKLQIPVEIQEPFVQARLEKALDLDQGGMTMSMSGYTVRVTGADVYGQGSQIAIKLTFSGDLTGTANLTGTPVYTPDTRMLSFPDLDYTLETSEALLKTASWFAHSEVRDRLRAKFTIDLAQSIDKMKEGLEAVLNRRRGNVQLHGTVQDLELLGVYRLPNGDVFTAYLSAKGTISAEIEAQ